MDALRVAYVNVQGLDAQTWRRVQGLVEMGTLDLAFVAETWYVGFERYVASPSTVAYTPRPTTKTGSRYRGGLCLLGSTRVRSRLGPPAVVTPDSIALTLGDDIIAGVYLPPSMSEREVEGVLEGVATASVLLGDVNVRYSGGRTPTPRERGVVIDRWAYSNTLRRLQPTAATSPVPGVETQQTLTVDHCYVRRTHVGDLLHLLSTGNLGILTDHQYMLLLMVQGMGGREHCPMEAKLPRFCIGKLGSARVAANLRDTWETVSRSIDRTFRKSADPDRLNDALVDACQRTCILVLGEASQTAKDSPRDTETEVSHHRLRRQLFALDEDNGPLFSGTAGVTALQEAATVLGKRYRAQGGRKPRLDGRRGTEDDVGWSWTADDIRDMIASQDGSKACGGDGVHMRALKALRDTTLAEYMATLYEACIAEGRTPRAWNRTEIQLIVKDKTKAKTVENARPITLITMFRKIFEGLLLQHIGRLKCLELHPAQAGFRSGYSTLTLAATVHIALEQRRCNGALFLDFRAAFDTVDQDLVRDVLIERGCPPRCVALLQSLGDGLMSRVMANGGASTWIPRGRGVLQGSPLSPLLWNVVADGLIRDLNEGIDGLPRAVFYADDGALLYREEAEIEPLLELVGQWCERNGIAVNAAKCGHVTLRPNPGRVYWGTDLIPQVQEYRYLGFLVTAKGIDFYDHLGRRLDQAKANARFMAQHSATWGVANRLRIYQQYLAPLVEYGAPLVWAGIARDRGRWTQMDAEWRPLIQWIAGGEAGWRVSQNLLGILNLRDRFECRHAAFLRDLYCARLDNPLAVMLFRAGQVGTFGRELRTSQIVRDWKTTAREEDLGKAGLKKFIRAWTKRKVLAQGRRSHLSNIIGWNTRLTKGLRYADSTLAAPRAMQDSLFRYRRGVWGYGWTHRCGGTRKPFRRGDEECACFQGWVRLGRRERAAKKDQAALQDGGPKGKFTDVDFLLNTEQWTRVWKALEGVRSVLVETQDAEGEGDTDSMIVEL